jgi:hypothetical protein
MARTYDTQALLNSTYLSKEHHADFETALKVECWLLHLAALIREGREIPRPPVDWLDGYWPDSSALVQADAERED